MEFLIGNKQEFLIFLNSITVKDNVGILTHNDIDGLVSGIFLEEILISKKIPLKFIDFLNYGEKIFQNLIPVLKKEKISKLFILDINAVDLDNLEEFLKLSSQFETFLIDHHPFDVTKTFKNVIKTNSYDCTAWTIYSLGKDLKLFDFKKWRWLVCVALIADYSFDNSKNLEFIRLNYPGIIKEKINDSIPGELAKQINSTIIYHRSLGKELKEVYSLVKEKNLEGLNRFHRVVEVEIKKIVQGFEKNAEFFPKKNLYFYFINSKFPIASTVATILSKEKINSSIFLASVFGNFIKINARNQNGGENVNLLIKKSILGLKNATGGGHAKASAAMILKKDLEEFKENLLK